MTTPSPSKIHAQINYEDTYVQPLLLAALKARIPPEILVLIPPTSQLPPNTPNLQWLQYENINFPHLLQNSSSSLANSYVIRKALIRKHYLASTVSHWTTKHPGSVLGGHVKGSVEFEVDYAEFLDEALVEAWELRESFERNKGEGEEGKEWWILKPGMSERGEGVRLFCSFEGLEGIFGGWDPVSDDEEEVEGLNGVHSDDEGGNATDQNGVITSQLRHFVAQPYIHPPLLLTSPHPSAGRKFHIRTYVLAVGALKVYVYKPMLALFAAEPYTAPSDQANEDLSKHLTNTCLQSGEREGSVCAFWSLPSHTSPTLPPAENWKENVFTQICATTAEVFEAAARSMSTHFQPLPNAFEVFGVDFLVDAEGTAWLLEVNAFPDFKQTGEELRGLVGGLFGAIVEVAVKPFFGLGKGGVGGEGMVLVLDVDLGRR